MRTQKNILYGTLDEHTFVLIPDGKCAYEVWKWLGKNCSRYCVHKVLYTECQSWPSHHPQLTCEVWKWLSKNCSRYRAHKVLYIECQSWPWPLTPWPKINRVPPLIMVNVHMKFESDWAKRCAFSNYENTKNILYGTLDEHTFVLIPDGTFKTRQRKAWHPLAGGQSWPWPLTPWPKINRVPPLIIHN